jgi:maleate isomerase
VVDYRADAGIEVVDSLSRNITDNCAGGRLDACDLVDVVDRLDLRRAEALVVSACVQMPSLDAIPVVQALPACRPCPPPRRRPARCYGPSISIR